MDVIVCGRFAGAFSFLPISSRGRGTQPELNLSSRGSFKKVQSRTASCIIPVACSQHAASAAEAKECVWNSLGAMALTAPILHNMPQIKIHLWDEIHNKSIAVGQARVSLTRYGGLGRQTGGTGHPLADFPTEDWVPPTLTLSPHYSYLLIHRKRFLTEKK